MVDIFPVSGAEADIMLAEDVASGERRVVKLYRQGLQPDFRLLSILAETAGDAVVRVLAHGVSEGTAYEVLEYIPHGTLQELLRSGPLARDEVRRIVEEIAEALNRIHAHRIWHRDLKPENVLLRSRSPLELALADFGIATLAAATQHFTSGARTTKYAAPEALTGVIEEKSDWWSLGMIAFEAATGRHPFDGLTEQVMNHHLATRPIDVRGVYDDDVRLLCRGLLLRDPRRRWGADEVARWLAGDTTLVAPEDGPASAVRPYRIDATESTTGAELALAMAKHWDVARRDLMRGQIMSWIEQELHDQNLARKLRDIQDHRALSEDARLLRFLLAAAPDLPPVWQGVPVSEEAIFAAARRAAGDDDGAAGWLDSLFSEDVLAQFTGDRHLKLHEIDGDWRQSWARFIELWQAARAAEEAWRKQPRAVAENAAAEVVLYDDVMYGSHLRLTPPQQRVVNGALLLAHQDPDHVTALRGEVIAALAEISGYCPWFESMWAETREEAVSVLVMHRLLPYARDEAEREKRRTGVSREARESIVAEARAELQACLSDLLDIAPDANVPLDRDTVANLLEALDPFQRACQKVVGLGYTDPDFEALRLSAEKLYSHGVSVQQALSKCEEVKDVNAIFLKPERLLIGGAILAFVMGLRLEWIGWPLLGAALSWGLYRLYVSNATSDAARKKLRLFRQYAVTLLWPSRADVGRGTAASSG